MAEHKSGFIRSGDNRKSNGFRRSDSNKDSGFNRGKNSGSGFIGQNIQSTKSAGGSAAVVKSVKSIEREANKTLQELENAKRELSAIESKITAANNEVAVISSEITSMSFEITTLQSAANQETVTVAEDHFAAIQERDSLLEKRDTLANEIASKDKRFDNLNKEIKSLSGIIADNPESEERPKLIAKRDSLLEERKAMSVDIADTEHGFVAKIGIANKEVRSLERKQSSLLSESVFVEKIAEVKKQRETLIIASATLTTELQTLESAKSAATSKIVGCESKVKSIYARANELATKIHRGVFGNVGKKISADIKGIVKQLGGVLGKVDPFAKGINKHSVDDTGVESIRLARQGFSKVQSVVKTTARTIKTTRRTVKATQKAAVRTAKMLHLTAVYTARVAVFTARTTVQVVTHTVALALNPVTWVVAGVLLVAVMMSGAFMVVLAPSAGKNASIENKPREPDYIKNFSPKGYWHMDVGEGVEFVQEGDIIHLPENDDHGDLWYLVTSAKIKVTGSHNIYWEGSYALQYINKDGEPILVDGEPVVLTVTDDDLLNTEFWRLRESEEQTEVEVVDE